jgi:hypothetical protein
MSALQQLHQVLTGQQRIAYSSISEDSRKKIIHSKNNKTNTIWRWMKSKISSRTSRFMTWMMAHRKGRYLLKIIRSYGRWGDSLIPAVGVVISMTSPY